MCPFPATPPETATTPKQTPVVFLTTPTALPTVLLRVGPTYVVMCVFYLRVNLRFLRVGGRVIVNMRFNNVRQRALTAADRTLNQR